MVHSGQGWPIIAWDVWRASRMDVAAATARQQARLTALVRYARDRSPFSRALYQQIPEEGYALGHLPPVTKAELMARFDDGMTDRAVTRAGVAPFVADKTRVGQPFLGRYLLCTTSGVTSHPGIFLHDAGALAVYQALTAIRAYLAWVPARRRGAALRAGGRVAVLVATGGHFVGAALVERIRRSTPWLAPRFARVFSVAQPLPALVRALNEFRPALLIGYPTALALLAAEQAAGRLRIKPILVATSGE